MGWWMVGVGEVAYSESVEVPVIEQQNVIEHLASEAADEALSRGVHVGCPCRNIDDPDSGSLGDGVEDGYELVVAISYNHLRGGPVHGGVPKLLCRPLLRRVPGDGEMNVSSGCEVDDEEGIDLPEEDVVALDEVASPGAFGVVLEEGRPCLSTSPGADPSHVLLDGTLTDLDTELEQFPTDTLSAPESTAAGHVANELYCFRW